MAIQCDDLEPVWFKIGLGGNGDYYPEIIYKDKDDNLIKKVQLRVCTSGSKISLKVRLALADLWRALDETNSNEWPKDI